MYTYIYIIAYMRIMVKYTYKILCHSNNVIT